MRRPALLAALLCAAAPLAGCASLLGEPPAQAASEPECAILAPALAAVVPSPDPRGQRLPVYGLTISPVELADETPAVEEGYPPLVARQARVDLKGCAALAALPGVRFKAVSRFRMPDALWGFGAFLSRPRVSPDGKRASVLVSQGHCGKDWVVALDRAPDGHWIARPLPAPREWVCVD